MLIIHCHSYHWLRFSTKLMGNKQRIISWSSTFKQPSVLSLWPSVGQLWNWANYTYDYFIQSIL